MNDEAVGQHELTCGKCNEVTVHLIGTTIDGEINFVCKKCIQNAVNNDEIQVFGFNKGE